MAMQRYKNLTGQSNVDAFEILDNGIIVQFNGHSQYTYQSTKVGMNNMTEMKRLAVNGKGLNSFINRTASIRNGYSKKISF